MKTFLKEFFSFGLKQIRACVFAGSFFVLLFASSHIPLFGLARYDFLFLGALLIQVILVLTKIESKDEVKTIFIFHIIGLCLEIFKTHPTIGSWVYPEEGLFKVMNVPLYSGFMYAAVASYISQAWRIMELRVEGYPKYIYSIPLSAAIYLNFFTHHFIPDFRWFLIILVFFVFLKTQVFFTVYKRERKIPLVLSFGLIAFFIWIAENISTYLGAWKYPDQIYDWNIVSFGKINAWFLLVILSIIIIFDLKQFKKEKTLSSNI